MNELKESDEELNAADVDMHVHHVYDEENAVGGEELEGDGEGDDEDELSLMNSEDERECMKRRKEKEVKINNSFTGPYPLDPTDFNHTDKGANFQFELFFANESQTANAQ
jgi:hypothetical protein